MRTALLFVDVQRNMLTGDAPVPSAAEITPVLEAVLEGARRSGAPVVHVLNDGGPGDPDEPETPGWAPVFPATEGERTVRKDRTDTFAANPGLAAELRASGIDRVVVAGMQSEHCIDATSRGALAAGFDVVLVGDAHATYDDGAPAAQISADVQKRLEADGVDVVPSVAVAW